MIVPNAADRSSHRRLLVAFALALIAALVLIARPTESQGQDLPVEIPVPIPVPGDLLGEPGAGGVLGPANPLARNEDLTPTSAPDATGPDPLRRAGGGKQLDVGFADFLYGVEGKNRREFKLTATTNADIIRVNMYWSLVAPQPVANPRDPSDPGYNWAEYDRAIKGATENGFDVNLTVLAAPGWAEGPNRPADLDKAPPGSWRPDAAAYGDFAAAVATRYSGSFAAGGETLPFVEYMEAWNEPNLSTYITPQWQGKSNEASQIYAPLLNAFYDEVKAVNPAIQVVAGGTAPYGDPPGGPNRTRPERFYQELLCLTPKNKRGDCPNGVESKFDIIAHHPINREDPPTEHADADGDIEIADFGELTKVLRTAEKLGTTGTPGKHDIWANEVWWQTDPPDKSEGVPLKTHARWMAQGMYLLWKQGASNVSFLQFRDAKYKKGEFTLASYQTGVYTSNGKRKLSADAVAFPFVTERKGKRLEAWGIAPATGNLTIEAKVAGEGGYEKVGSAKVKSGKVFTTMLQVKDEAKLRAKVGGKTSVVWDQQS